MGLQLLGCNVGDSISGVGGWLEGEEVSQETTDVRRGHGSSRNSIGGIFAPNPGGLDVEARSEDISALENC